MCLKICSLLGLFIASEQAMAGGSIWHCYGVRPGEPAERPSTVLTWSAVYANEPLTISGDAHLRVLDGVSVSEKVPVTGDTSMDGYSGKIIPAKMDESKYTFFAQFELSKTDVVVKRLRCFQR